MKTKILTKLRKEAKEEVYLSQSFSEAGKLCIIHKIDDAPFGLTISFYNPDLGTAGMFEQNEFVNYNTVEEALPDLAKARRYYILNVLHAEYRRFSKGQQKREEIERLKYKDYQKYLQQF